MRDLRRLLRYVTPYWKHMAAAALTLGLGSLVLLALPWTLRLLIDTAFEHRDPAQLNRIGLGLLVLFAAQSVMVYFQTYLMTYVANRVIADLRMDVYNHVLELPLRFFHDRRWGEIASRLTNDVAVTQAALTSVPVNLLRQLITFGGGLAFLLWLDWRLAAVIVVLAPVLAALAFRFGRRLQWLTLEVQDASANLSAALEETLAGAREIKAFSREGYEQERFRQTTEVRFAALMRQNRAQALFLALISLAGLSALLLLLWYGGRQVIEGVMSPGDLVASLIYLGVVVGPLGEFAWQYTKLREALGATQRIQEIMDAAREPLRSRSGTQLPRIAGQVRFVDVSFHYAENQPVLKHVNLTVKPGEVVALVGRNGVGKTTLVNLIPRFYELQTGRIEIDDCDIRQVNLASLRRQIALVPQETFLFSGSVGENIAYGRPGATGEEIAAAAQAAYAHEFISALPNGYDTPVGERGVKLSAGQRQRLAIARALLKDPRLLILDEATTYLDPESERCIELALARLMRERTAFVIAHRLSTVQRADRILVLEDGEIVEQGTHEALLALEGIYQGLFGRDGAAPRP